jgi:class 3 adenylate cyclase
MGQAARVQTGIETLTYSPIVQASEVSAWIQYSTMNQWWIEQSRYVALQHAKQNDDITVQVSDYKNGSVPPFIYDVQLDGIGAGVFSSLDHDGGIGPYAPTWHLSPPPFSAEIVNSNLLQFNKTRSLMLASLFSRDLLFSMADDYSDSGNLLLKESDHAAFHHRLYQFQNESSAVEWYHRPHTLVALPVFEICNDDSSRPRAILMAMIAWDRYLINLLPRGTSGITCVIRNTCNQSYSYEINGQYSSYVGPGDYHDENFDHTERVIPFYVQEDPVTSMLPGHCLYSLHIYASSSLEASYHSIIPQTLAWIVAFTFCVMATAFYLYDRFVRQRNDKVIDTAARSTAVVLSLFPLNVRDRLYNMNKQQKNAKDNSEENKTPEAVLYAKSNVALDQEECCADDNDSIFMYESNPIADTFPHTTILFGDISGFTAWSSSREPSQVFILLETIYKAFDDIARRRGVYKVETIGDCYVAVTGLPDPQSDHAVRMARFARDCLYRMQVLTHKLQGTLGSDTNSLVMRFGMHSGPVIAGVLRGDRSRFQLFGDTMNTASRMESTGYPGLIQLSQDTANSLIDAGKCKWVVPRKDLVVAKGKGEMQTYWLRTSTSLPTTDGDE